jgi:hypothetical protein
MKRDTILLALSLAWTAIAAGALLYLFLAD